MFNNAPCGPSEDFTPIGSGNPSNPDLRVNCDQANNTHDLHVDMVVRLPEIGGAHKIRVGADETIISDEIT